jgi:hypothetical protein
LLGLQGEEGSREALWLVGTQELPPERTVGGTGRPRDDLSLVAILQRLASVAHGIVAYSTSSVP